MTSKELIDEIVNKIIPSIKPDIKTGRYELSGESYYNVDEYISRPLSECRFESHKKYIDVQYLIKGEELIYTAHVDELEESAPYSEQKDVVFYLDPEFSECNHLKAGEYLIFYPNDAHKPSVCINDGVNIKKIVFKVRVDETDE